MNSTRLLQVIAVVVLIAGLGLISNSVYKIMTRAPLVRHKEPMSALAVIRAQDEARLEAGASSGARVVDENPQEIAKSLRRYAEQNLPKSKDFVLKYIKSEDKIIRGAAIESIGAYPDADIELFEQALKDSNAEYRISTLRGLAKRSDETRISLVTKHADRNDLPAEEKLESFLALVRLYKTTNDKEIFRDKTLAALASISSEQQSAVLQTLFELLPNDNVLVGKAYEVVGDENSAKSSTKNSSSPVVGAFQYLVAFDSQNLKQKVYEFPIRKNETYQMVLIDYLVSACPDKWQDIADKMESSGVLIEKNRQHLKDARKTTKCRVFK